LTTKAFIHLGSVLNRVDLARTVSEKYTVEDFKMSEQQSQKRGVRSDAQKTATARNDYEPIPPANPVAGAFGKQQPQIQSDQDLALSREEKRRQAENPDETSG
jgi:hypothetical protein